MNTNEKLALLDKLTYCHNRISYAMACCNDKGQDTGELQKRLDSLDSEIDRLRSELDKDWIGDADGLKADFDHANAEIDICINNIKMDVAIAQNIVKLLGYVDYVIKIASAL